MNCKFCDKYFIHIGAHERCCILNLDRDKFLLKLKKSSIKAADLKKQKWDDYFTQIKSIIENKGGKCLSTEYLGFNNKIKIECSEGHIWGATAYSITDRGTWCKICQDKKLDLTIEDFKILAQEKYGKCLSDSYNYNDEKLLWECYFGHQWMAKPSQIKTKSWCPICSSGLYERICRLFMEELFNKPFTKIRPKWLIGKNKFPLELDGYCEELNIAFEHNGFQHYDDRAKSIFNIKDLKENDILKRKLCDENKVKLIIIPELFSQLKLKDLKNFIKNECIKLDITLPSNFDEITVNYNKIYKSNNDLIMINKMEDNLSAKNMKLLTKFYLGISGPIEIQCLLCNKIYNKTAQFALNNPYCDFCNSGGCSALEINKFFIDGKILLSDISKFEKLPLAFSLKCQCICGFIFNKQVKNLIKGSWCIKCARIKNPHRKRKSLEERQIFANKFDGSCLDTIDLKDQAHSSWKCKNDHIFSASFKSMRKRNNFCLICNPYFKLRVNITGKFK